MKLAPKPAAAPTLEATVFFESLAGGHRVLGRSNALNSCKAFLARAGRGWMAYPDPGLDGDDLTAVTSPDGQHLALISSRGGAVNLWLVSPDGQSLSNVSDDQGGIMDAAAVNDQSVAFSNDSKRLAWIQRGRVWVMDLATDEPHTLCLLKGALALAWSPDDRWLAVSTGDSIHKVGPHGEPDFVLVPYGVSQPWIQWDPDPKADTLYFINQGLRKVDGQRKISMLMTSPVDPNSAALVGKQAVLLNVAPSGKTEVYRDSLDGKTPPLQVTLGGAQGVWALGQTLCFVRDGLLWRCGLDGAKARPLSDIPVEGVSIGILPPLAGACP